MENIHAQVGGVEMYKIEKCWRSCEIKEGDVVRSR